MKIKVALQQTKLLCHSQQLLSNSFVPESESMGVVGRLVGVEGLRHWLKKLRMCVDNSCLQEPSTSPRRISWTKSGSILWQKSVFTYSSKRVFHSDSVFHLHWDFGSDKYLCVKPLQWIIKIQHGYYFISVPHIKVWWEAEPHFGHLHCLTGPYTGSLTSPCVHQVALTTVQNFPAYVWTLRSLPYSRWSPV